MRAQAGTKLGGRGIGEGRGGGVCDKGRVVESDLAAQGQHHLVVVLMDTVCKRAKSDLCMHFKQRYVLQLSCHDKEMRERVTCNKNKIYAHDVV